MADHEHEKKSGGHGGGHGPGGHGGGEHEESGAPEWLISFADNVALLMGFFAILLAINMKPASAGADSGDTKGEASGQPSAEMVDWALAIREAFNNPVNFDNPSPNDLELVRQFRLSRSEVEARTRGQSGMEREVRSIRRSEYFGVGGVISFEQGTAELDAAGHKSLAEVLKARRGVRNIIEVRGHVSAAEAFDLPDRGMALSYERALKVAGALVEAGISWSQIQVVACADSDRVALKTYDRFGHRANQRVEIIETDTPMLGDEPAAGTSGGPAPGTSSPAGTIASEPDHGPAPATAAPSEPPSEPSPAPAAAPH